MTAFIIFAASNDQYIDSINATYATCSAGSNLSVGGGPTVLSAGQSLASNSIDQTFLSFDTSAVPAGTPTSNPTLTISVTVNPVGGLVFDCDIVNWSGTTGAWVPGANLAAQSEFDHQTITGTGVKTFTTTTNPARSATYKLMIYGHLQELGTTWGGNEYINFSATETAGTGSDPYLTIVVAVAYTLAITKATFTLTGKDANLKAARQLPITKATFSLTGVAAGLQHGKTITVTPAAFVLTGKAAVLTSNRRMPLTAGAFTLTGNNAALKAARQIVIDPAVFTFTGRSIGIALTPQVPYDRTITLDGGELEGRTVTLDGN